MSRVYDQGSLVRIALSPDDIRVWKRRWPGSGIPSSKSISFTFEKKNGNLVDVSTRYDGEDLAAMSHDAYNVWLDKRHKDMVREQGSGLPMKKNPDSLNARDRVEVVIGEKVRTFGGWYRHDKAMLDGKEIGRLQTRPTQQAHGDDCVGARP